MSEIRRVDTQGGYFIVINGKRITSPYMVKVIGDSSYLESGLTIKGGYVDVTKSIGEEISINKSDNILILKYDGDIKTKYLN